MRIKVSIFTDSIFTNGDDMPLTKESSASGPFFPALAILKSPLERQTRRSGRNEGMRLDSTSSGFNLPHMASLNLNNSSIIQFFISVTTTSTFY